MTPMPIIIPISGSGSTLTNNCTFPSWVVGVTKIGIAVTVLGFIVFLICALLYMVTDNERFNIIEKPGAYTLVVCIGGITITLIGLVLMLFTATPITE